MSDGSGTLANDVRRIADDALRIARGTNLEPAVAQVRRRLDEPLRVAIAGRVKAGKSTLLNALVGERLAATDAGECTRIVTWYRHDHSYRVTAELRPSGTQELEFRRNEGELQIELGELELPSIERIEVGWPSKKLADLTLIDTPGLGSTDETTSERTMHALLDEDAEGPGEADAVLYLMRHLHRSDSRFLEAFLDRSIERASPVNAIVVLSRADEIGAARPDALSSARSIAERYAADPQVRELASGVIPVAGLIAETAATLRQEQFGWLRDIAALDEARRTDLLRSVDRFRDPEQNPLGEEIREELLTRLGLFGLRLAIRLLVDGEVRTATELSNALLEHSGIRELQRSLADHYGVRAQVLKARSALVALRAIGKELDRRAIPDASRLVEAVDRLDAGSQDLAMLRLLHMVMTGLIALASAERDEVDRLSSAGPGVERVGLPPGAAPGEVRTAALAGIERWRSRAGNPMSDRRMIEAAEIVSRAYEEIYAGAG